MSDERVWLHHPETDGYFHCPVGAVDDWTSRGWEASEAPPAEPSPVVAEHLAWRDQQAGDSTPTKTTARQVSRKGTEGVTNG